MRRLPQFPPPSTTTTLDFFPPPPPGAPGYLLVREGADEDEFKDIVRMLVAHGVEHIDDLIADIENALS